MAHGKVTLTQRSRCRTGRGQLPLEATEANGALGAFELHTFRVAGELWTKTLRRYMLMTADEAVPGTERIKPGFAEGDYCWLPRTCNHHPE